MRAVLRLVPLLAAMLFPLMVAPPATPAKPSTKPATEASKDPLAGVKPPAGFEMTLFAAPPRVNYPTCLTATPRGELFVGIDEQGSLGREPNKGRVVRCVDSDDDGVADQIVTFAPIEHPRGLVWDDAARALYVLHPPTLERFFDDDGDGVADRHEILVNGIGNTKMQAERGADHTTNGIRLGIDGWIYIAVGDFGCPDAVGADGTHLQLHGGGIVRVRTDGSGIETFITGTRNIYDVAIDPLMNVFSRDNTNDGDGWNDRLAYDVPGGYYGYPGRFKHFPGEFVDCLVDFGGGSPCGALFVDEPALPEPLRYGLYTVEWGNNCIDRHPLTPSGAGFKVAATKKLMDLPRGTDIDVDGAGRLYVSSWANGGFNYSGPDVGYVIRLSPKNTQPQPFPDLHAASDEELLEHLKSSSGVRRQAVQREILKRGDKPAFASGLISLARSADAPLAGRVAALFTLELLRGDAARGELLELCRHDDLRELALRALADLKGDTKLPLDPFVAAAGDRNPRVRLIAAWSMGRLGAAGLSSILVTLANDTDPLVAHVAVNSLVELNAGNACLASLNDPARAVGALRALQSMHEPAVVDGLVARLADVKDAAVRSMMHRTLCRLWSREADWDGSWWGTRPDTSGPYYKPVAWSQTPRIADVIRSALKSEQPQIVRSLLLDCAANKVDLPEIREMLLSNAETDEQVRVALLRTLAGKKNLSAAEIAVMARIARSDANDIDARATAIRLLSGADDDAAIEVAVEALGPVAASGEHKTELSQALDSFIHEPQHAKRIAFLSRWADHGSAGEREVAFAAILHVAEGKLTESQPRAAAEAAVARAWQDPPNVVPLLRAIGRTKASGQADQVRARMSGHDAAVAKAARDAAKRLGITSATAPASQPLETIASMRYDEAAATVLKIPGDASLGKELFARQGCVACHTVSPDEPPKGPFLGGISARYGRSELCESILKPSAKIAQGFETQWFKTPKDVVEGFVTRESGDEIELRTVTGSTTVLKKDQVKSRGKRDISVMPEGLAAKLSPQELASLIAYLESLKAK